MYLHPLHCSRCDRWLVDIMRLTTSCSLKSNWIVCCPFFHKSPLNCTFIYYLKFEDWASMWHWANRLKQALLGEDTVLSAAAPQVALCGCGVEDLARVPILTSLQRQQQNAKCLSHTVQGHWRIITRTVTELTRTRKLSMLFRLWIRRRSLLGLGAPPVPSCPVPSHLISGPRMEIIATEIQPVDSAY